MFSHFFRQIHIGTELKGPVGILFQDLGDVLTTYTKVLVCKRETEDIITVVSVKSAAFASSCLRE